MIDIEAHKVEEAETRDENREEVGIAMRGFDQVRESTEQE